MKDQTFPTPAIYGPYDVAVAENKRLRSDIAKLRQALESLLLSGAGFRAERNAVRKVLEETK